MNQYYETTQISDEILLIKEIGFLEHSNIFVIGKKSECYIFDTGIGISNLKEFLIRLGYKKFTVFLSHAHFDHFGGIIDFNPDEIIITEKVHHHLKDKKYWAINYLNERYFENTASFNKTINKLEKMLNFAERLKSTKLLDLEICNNKIEIIETPGHTDDSIVLNDSTHQILLTGDSLYVGTMYVEFFKPNMKKIKETLRKIKNLSPNLILPGHGQIITDLYTQKNIQNWVSDLDMMFSTGIY